MLSTRASTAESASTRLGRTLSMATSLAYVMKDGQETSAMNQRSTTRPTQPIKPGFESQKHARTLSSSCNGSTRCNSAVAWNRGIARVSAGQ